MECESRRQKFVSILDEEIGSDDLKDEFTWSLDFLQFEGFLRGLMSDTIGVQLSCKFLSFCE
jgi:hypothetical protein